jgi:DNA-binding transcriptional ArsR family regulator
MEKHQVLAALAAIAHESRLDAFRLLVEAGPAGVAAGNIAARLGVRQNTMSTHLSILASSGLIRRAREGRVIRYRAAYDAMRELLEYLLRDCCQGDQAICAPLADTIKYRTPRHA